MRIRVKVKARAKQNRVEAAGDGRYKVWVKAVPEKGRANAAVIEALSDHLGVPKSKMSVAGGRASAEKIVEIEV